MSERTLSAANEAVFHLQLSSDEAIRYVVRHSQCDAKTAGQALKEVMVGYKSR
jgi:hypothetical protein